MQFDNVPDIKTLDSSGVSYTPSNDLGKYILVWIRRLKQRGKNDS